MPLPIRLNPRFPQTISNHQIRLMTWCFREKMPAIFRKQTHRQASFIMSCSSVTYSLKKIAKQPLVKATPWIYAPAIRDAKGNGVSLVESPKSSETDMSARVNGRDGKRPVENDIQVPISHHPAPPVQPTTPSHAAAHKRDDSFSESSNTSGSSQNASKSKFKGSSGSPAAGPHKSRFMDKIKGEVKVLSGKLAHNEEKVEEGRRLMGKAA